MLLRSSHNVSKNIDGKKDDNENKWCEKCCKRITVTNSTCSVWQWHMWLLPAANWHLSVLCWFLKWFEWMNHFLYISNQISVESLRRLLRNPLCNYTFPWHWSLKLDFALQYAGVRCGINGWLENTLMPNIAKGHFSTATPTDSFSTALP